MKKTKNVRKQKLKVYTVQAQAIELNISMLPFNTGANIHLETFMSILGAKKSVRNY